MTFVLESLETPGLDKTYAKVVPPPRHCVSEITVHAMLTRWTASSAEHTKQPNCYEIHNCFQRATGEYFQYLQLTITALFSHHAQDYILEDISRLPVFFFCQF